MPDWKKYININHLITIGVIAAFSTISGVAVVLWNERSEVLGQHLWTLDHRIEYEQSVKPQLSRIESKLERIESYFRKPMGRAVVESVSSREIYALINISGPGAQVYLEAMEDGYEDRFITVIKNVTSSYRPEVRIPVIGIFDETTGGIREDRVMIRLSPRAGELLGVSQGEFQAIIELVPKIQN
jgi:hypothetical protein